MRHVILQHFFFHAPERGPDRRDLGDDIDAIAVLVHHPGQAAHLALDAVQTLLTGRLDVFSHEAYIPLAGICCKAGRSSRWAKLTRRSRPASPGNPAAAAPLNLLLPLMNQRRRDAAAAVAIRRIISKDIMPPPAGTCAIPSAGWPSIPR